MECILLASGSKGNCIYIGNGTDAVVIDAGMGYIKKTLEEHKLNTDIIRALCITHEHSDHARSAKAFIKTMQIPTIGTSGTLNALVRQNLLPINAKLTQAREHLNIDAGSLTITAFRTYHDASEPSGFIVDDGDARIGICLDTAKVSPAMQSALKSCDAVILESNYSSHAMKTDKFPNCPECRFCGADCRGISCVLRQYPRYLKDRIREDGHLSNEASSEVLKKLSTEVGIFALAHLSENYNRPNLARLAAEDAAGESGAEIHVSDQLFEYRKNRLVRFQV